MKIPSNIF